MENEKQIKFDKFRFFAILILILIGIGLCVELGYIFYKTNFIPNFAQSFCSVDELIDCDGVSLTPYALSFGVPNALWGLFLYLVMLMLLFVDKIQAKFKNTIFDVFENPRSYIASLGVLSFAISMGLAYISLQVIHKICVLCVCTYFINFFIALLARTKGFFLSDIKTTVIDFIKGAKKYLVLFLVVLVAFVSGLYYLNDTLIFSPKLKEKKLHKEFYESKKNRYAVKGNILGDENALVVINAYSDYYCPFCRVVNMMLHKAAKERKILVNEIHFPLDTNCNYKITRGLAGHENACVATRYAIAAKKQGKFWGVANAFFETHPKTKAEIFEALSKARLGLDLDMLERDANSNEAYEKLYADIETTSAKGVYATPTIEINGVIYVGAMPYKELINKIDLAQKRAQN